jgi:hypothetical protein
MSNLTDYAEKKLNDHILGITSYTKPTATYASLHTASPTDTGSHSNEITGSFGLTRLSITASMNATGATSGLADNASALEIGPCNANAGTVTHAGLEDASTVGNMLLWVANTASRTLLSGDSFRWAAGQLTVTFA